MQDILVLIKTMRDYYHHAHLVSKNSVFYADHLLFERLYDGVSGYVDGIQEKMLGLGMGEASIEPKVIYKKVFEKLAKLPFNVKENASYVTACLSLEEELRKAVDVVDKDESTSCGLKNFIGDIADKSEDRTYLLKQRIAK